MTYLLDANAVIALATLEHVHHDAAEHWFAALQDGHATCPITQGALVRFLLREGATATDAVAQVIGMVAHRRHEFWPDAIGFEAVRLAGVVGHRQVTDAYLAALARHRGGRVATFDNGFAALHPDAVSLIPS